MEFDFATAQTVTGFTLAQVVAEMQKPLPAAAYKPVPGATDLTDIDPAYLPDGRIVFASTTSGPAIWPSAPKRARPSRGASTRCSLRRCTS